MKFKLVETVLIEDIAAVKKQYSHIPEEDFDKIIRLDPTFDENRDSVGKYGKWLLGLYKKDNPLNTPGATTFLQMYDEVKKDPSKKIEKDIGKFKSFRELYDAISNAEDVELSDRQKLRRRQADQNYDIVYEDSDWTIYVPNTWEASVNLGKGTKWCTSDSREDYGKKYWNQYLSQGGKYYILVNKHDKSEKYQFHFESGQFMDADDSAIYPSDVCNAEMEQFFNDQGYDINMSIDYDMVMEAVFGDIFPGNDRPVELPVDIRGLVNNVAYEEDWYFIASAWDLMNGYYDQDTMDELFITPFIQELMDSCFSFMKYKTKIQSAKDFDEIEQLLINNNYDQVYNLDISNYHNLMDVVARACSNYIYEYFPELPFKSCVEDSATFNEHLEWSNYEDSFVLKFTYDEVRDLLEYLLDNDDFIRTTDEAVNYFTETADYGFYNEVLKDPDSLEPEVRIIYGIWSNRYSEDLFGAAIDAYKAQTDLFNTVLTNIGFYDNYLVPLLREAGLTDEELDKFFE